MLRDLLPFICRRLGLSTIQLGILDSLTLRLAVGQKLRKDQVAMLYADMPARDLEAVLSVFFEESSDGHLSSAEAQLLHEEMVNGTASGATSDSTNATSAADRTSNGGWPLFLRAILRAYRGSSHATA